jgi:hypothetical protein
MSDTGVNYVLKSKEVEEVLDNIEIRISGLNDIIKNLYLENSELLERWKGNVSEEFLVSAVLLEQNMKVCRMNIEKRSGLTKTEVNLVKEVEKDNSGTKVD